MASVLTHPVPEAQDEPWEPRVRGFGRPATLLGLFGLIVSAAGSWRPSYWGDEAASVLSAERSLPSLFRMLGNVDAVHGAYYLFLHFWIDVFGTSEFATRLPSAIAVGIATAGTAVLARQLTNVRVAVIAGVVFAVLPRVTYMGAEARSFALATAIAVWLTVLLVHVLRTEAVRPPAGRTRWSDSDWRHTAWWAGYAVLLAAGVYLFIYVLLLVPVHALMVLLIGRRAAPWRAWAASSVAGIVLALPVLYWGIREREQIDFLARRPQVDALEAAVHQWFGKAPLAVAAWALVILALATVFLIHRDRARPVGTTRGVVAMMLAWMLVPSTALLLGTEVLTPMYALRYLSFCTPAVAIAIAVGIACFRLPVMQAVALLVIVALTLPTYLAQRGEFAKNGGSDWRRTAELLKEKVQPGDAVVFDETIRPSRKTRLVYRMYPEAFSGVQDVTLGRPYYETDFLWDETLPLPDVVDRLSGIQTVWLVQFRGSRQNTSQADVLTLEQLGFSVAGSTLVRRTEVIEMTR